jgi:hypothetical protein
MNVAMIEDDVRLVFNRGLFFAPDRSRFRDVSGQLSILTSFLESLGYTKKIGSPPPRYYFDPVDGECAYAKYVSVEPPRSSVMLVALSFVSAVFTVTDDYYVYSSLWDSHSSSWSRKNLALSLDALPYSNLIKEMSARLDASQNTYVPWDSTLLDTPVTMRDKADATLRDCLFNYDLQ